MNLLLRIILLLSLLPFIRSLKPTAEELAAFEAADKLILHLNSAAFKPKIASGHWLVFYGATWCPHCIKFTPTWLQLQQKVQESQYAHFNIAKVECTTNEDLCEGLDGFPTVLYYKDGEKIGKEIDFRELNDLFNFVVQHANDPLKKVKINHIDVLKTIADDETQPDTNINPQGTLTHLTQANFASLTNNTPWFVMFHAPWCSHCKALKPTWEKLPKELIGQANVGMVDCTVETALRDKYNVKGFPTLLLLREPEPPIEYKGPRSFDSLKQFALDIVAKPSFKPISGERIKEIIEESESAFIFIYDPDKMDIKDVRIFLSVAKTVKSLAKIYVSPSASALAKFQNNDGVRTLIAVKDGGVDQTQYTGSFTGDAPSRTTLRNWILNQRLPLVPKLDSSSQAEILRPDKIVAMAIIDPSQTSGESALQNMRDAAISWKKTVNHRRSHQVSFAWIDGTQYSQYIKNVYGVNPGEMPSLIIADVSADEYYDSYANGRKYDSFTKGNVHNAIQEVLNGVVKAKSRNNFFIRTFKAFDKTVLNMIAFIFNRPLLTIVLLMGTIGSIYYCFIRSSHEYQQVRASEKAE